jgi:hypothetical protein
LTLSGVLTARNLFDIPPHILVKLLATTFTEDWATAAETIVYEVAANADLAVFVQVSTTAL